METKEAIIANVLSELKHIAKELKVELENEKVLLKYYETYSSLPDEIANEIHPIYFRADNRIYGILRDSNTGETIAHKKTKDGCWTYLNNNS